MKDPNYLNIQIFKVFVLSVFIGLNVTTVFGQDDESMQDANIALDFVENGEANKIVATVTDMDGNPVEELDLYFYVKRTFSNLPIGDVFNTTDEEGMVTITFPNDLPGDHEGNVIILTKIMESDLYNDLTIETTKKWGIPTPNIDQLEEKRSLWAASANAPISLILIVSSLIISVWFIICYIIYKLYRISKIRTSES